MQHSNDSVIESVYKGMFMSHVGADAVFACHAFGTPKVPHKEYPEWFFANLKKDVPEARLLFQYDRTFGKRRERVYGWDQGIVVLSFNSDGEPDIEVLTTVQQTLDAIMVWVKEGMEKRSSKGRIYVVTTDGSGGMRLQSLGNAAADFIPENYEPKLVVEYDHVVSCLRSKDPCGRMVLLDGPPGCGKSYALRGMLSLVPKSTVIMVPPHMVASMADPAFVELLLQERQVAMGPIVLVVEDADHCLLTRSSDNMSAISSILNLSDGLMGSMLDLRVVCTTNAKPEKMDEAIMRPGRLCRHLRFNKLLFTQASDVYRRLLGDPEADIQAVMGDKRSSTYTLADVYRAAKDRGMQVPPQQQTSNKTAGIAGFYPDTQQQMVRYARTHGKLERLDDEGNGNDGDEG